jgi:hypothetical protein
MKFNSYGRTDITPFTISQEDMDEIMQRARAERAEVMHAVLVKVAAWFKTLPARIRGHRQRLPKDGAWA